MALAEAVDTRIAPEGAITSSDSWAKLEEWSLEAHERQNPQARKWVLHNISTLLIARSTMSLNGGKLSARALEIEEETIKTISRERGEDWSDEYDKAERMVGSIIYLEENRLRSSIQRIAGVGPEEANSSWQTADTGYLNLAQMWVGIKLGGLSDKMP